MVNVLSGRIEALATMAENAGSVGLGVEVKEEGGVGNRQAPMEDIERVLEFIWMQMVRTHPILMEERGWKNVRFEIKHSHGSGLLLASCMAISARTCCPMAWACEGVHRSLGPSGHS